MTPARYWHTGGDGRVVCDLCPRHCALRQGQAGFCFVRRNTGGQLELTARPSGFAIDPVEKKPLNHVAPGARVLSFGTPGCSLACRFCQNWELSTARQYASQGVAASPETIAELAIARGCQGVAYTYNDPTIYAEYAIDIAQAVRARGLLNIAVTAGYINPVPRADFFEHMDAANVDLKSIRPDFYRRVVNGHLEAVQDTLRYLAHETNVWVEVTNLVIPGLNDSKAELHELAAWIATELGPDVPLHLTAFHPDHRLLDVPATPPATLRGARQIAQGEGLRFVYTGNVADAEGSTTWCPHCGAALIVRDGYRVTANHIDNGPDNGRCAKCGAVIPGRWSRPPSRRSW